MAALLMKLLKESGTFLVENVTGFSPVVLMTFQDDFSFDQSISFSTTFPRDFNTIFHRLETVWQDRKCNLIFVLSQA